MAGIVGVVLLVTFLIAGAIPGKRDWNGESPSAGRFILRFIIAWVMIGGVAGGGQLLARFPASSTRFSPAFRHAKLRAKSS